MTYIESFGDFINENYISASPGSIVVPGEWYKDNVNSVNYVDKVQPLPQIVEPMFELSSLKSHLDDLSEDNEFRRILKNSSADSRKVTKYIKDSVVKKYSK